MVVTAARGESRPERRRPYSTTTPDRIKKRLEGEASACATAQNADQQPQAGKCDRLIADGSSGSLVAEDELDSRWPRGGSHQPPTGKRAVGWASDQTAALASEIGPWSGPGRHGASFPWEPRSYRRADPRPRRPLQPSTAASAQLPLR